MNRRIIAVMAVVAVALFSLPACGSGKSSKAAATNGALTAPPEATSTSSTANGGAIPDCGAVQAVWANLNTKVYHTSSDPLYGKTKHGEYLCPSQATAQGFHAAGSAPRHKHPKGSMSSM
jgi:hypothetical protein